MQRVIDIIRRFPIIVILPAIAVAVFIMRDHLPGAAADLRVGDCFNEPAEMEEIEEVQHRPCGEVHDAEVFAVLEHPAGPDEPYPIVSGVQDFVLSDCMPLFATYTGAAFDSQTELDVGWFYPTFLGWGDGDRVVTCYLRSVSGQLTASRRAAQ